MCDVCEEDKSGCRKCDSGYPSRVGASCAADYDPDFGLRTVAAPVVHRHCRRQDFLERPEPVLTPPPPAVEWQHVYPPMDCDVVLPSALNGRYKLLLPAASHRGRPLYWGFEEVGCTQGVHMEANYSPPGYRAGFVSRAPRMPRVIGYTEPSYLLNWPEGSTTSECRIGPPPSGIGKDGYTTTEKGKGWTIFHCTGGPGESPHTLICVGNTLVEIHKDVQVQIAQMPPTSWFKRWTHQQAVCLGDRNPNFRHCYLAYSDEIPSTHILVDHFAIHIDEPVPVVLTLAATGHVAHHRCP